MTSGEPSAGEVYPSGYITIFIPPLAPRLRVITFDGDYTRYTVHGRGAKHGSVEHIISVWIHSRPVSNGDSFQSVFSRMPSLSHPKNHF